MPLIRILSRGNGHGLSRDLGLVASLLADAGNAIEPVAFSNEKGLRYLHMGGMWLERGWKGRADLQISLEHIYPPALPLARRNLWMPNPEWFKPRWRDDLGDLSGTLCKTRHAEDIFAGFGCRPRFVGFTSEDRIDHAVPRQRRFLHLAGKSPVKGTEAVLEAWRRHPEWPELVVVQTSRHARVGAVPAGNIDHRVGRMPNDELRRLQNACRFHLSPSEAEGFGHCLVEGMSVGAVILTTDGEPMNELVRPGRGLLIEPARVGTLGLARRHFVDAAGIERAVAQALAMTDAEVEAMGAAARAAFEAMDRDFRERFAGHVAEMSRH